MTATPLQNAVLMASIINGGRRVRPHLAVGKEKVGETLFSSATLEAIRTGMRKCVEKGPPAPTGTGKLAAIEGKVILGKTGSAQMVSLKQHEEYETEEDIPKHLRDHAWFVAYAPAEEPQIVVAVLNEHSGHGGSKAAPIAVKVIDAWYDRYLATAGPTPVAEERPSQPLSSESLQSMPADGGTQ